MSEVQTANKGSATVGAEAKPKRWKSKERRWTAGVILGVLAVSVLVQWLVPSTPYNAVVICVATVLSLLVASLVSRRIRFIVGAFRYAAAALFVLAAVAGLGTMILQDKPAQFYQERYSTIAGVILALRLDDVFHGLIFSAILGTVIGGLVVAMIPRWPIRRRNLGFFICHGGLVVTLVGTSLSSLFAVRGRLDLRLQAPSLDAVAARAGAGLPEREVPLGFSVKLDKFEVEKYGAEYRVGLYLPAPDGGYRLKASFDPEVGVRHRLPRGASFEVKGYYPDLVFKTSIVDGVDRGDPVLRVTIDGQERWVREQERPTSADGAFTLAFGWNELPPAPTEGFGHTLVVGEGKQIAVGIGAAVEVEKGVSVKALRFFPHFTFDVQGHGPRNMDDLPVNPALEVEVVKNGGSANRRWLFANTPGFRHGEDDGVMLSYRNDQHGPPTPVAILIKGKDKTVVVRRDGAEEKHALGESLDLEGGRVRLGQIIERAVEMNEPASASEVARNPAVLLALQTSEGAREELLTASSSARMTFGNNQLLLFERRQDEVKAFRSTVTLNGGGVDRTVQVAVNQPLHVAGWTFYQANYDPNDPNYSGLDAVYDPGVTVVFFGFGMIVVGVLYVVYLAPRMRARKVARS